MKTTVAVAKLRRVPDLDFLSNCLAAPKDSPNISECIACLPLRIYIYIWTASAPQAPCQYV